MKFSFLFVIIVVVGIVAISGCTQQGTPITKKSPTPTQTPTSGLTLTSSAFSNNGNIPTKYTCEGEDTSPPLQISRVPSGTKSLILVMDDPDAVGVAGKVWDHWVVFNIDPSTREISENQQFGTAGITSSSNKKYEGPCPPEQHSYSFRLYALSKTLDLQEGATKLQVELSIQGSILAQTELVGKYAPQKAVPTATGSAGYDSPPSISSSRLSPSNPGVNETFALELTAEDDKGVKQFLLESSIPLSQGQSKYFDCNLQKICSTKWQLSALNEGEQKITVYTTDSSDQQIKKDFTVNVGPAKKVTPTPTPSTTTSLISSPTATTSVSVSECNSNSDCGYKERCAAGNCIDVECTTDSQCSGCKRCSSYSCVSCGKGPYGCYC